jgi:hypothetical protein
VELVDRATTVLRAQWREVLSLALVVQLTVWLILAVVLREQWARGLGDNQIWFWVALVPDPTTVFSIAGNSFDASVPTVLLGRALPSFGLAVIGAGCAVLVSDWAKGIATTGMEALQRVARQGHRLLGLWALVHVIEVGTCIGVVLGPVVLGIAAPLMFIEGTSVRQTLVRSWRLSKRALGRLCAAVLCATVTATLAAAILSGIPILIVGGVTSGWTDLGGTTASALGAAAPHLFLDPLLGLSMSLIAIDLRIRFEAVDLTEALDDLRHD